VTGPLALQVDIVAGGTVDAAQEAAIVEAVTRVLRARDAGRPATGSAWALAGRTEGVGAMRVRSRSALPR
jgi:hypothetical protein